MNYITYFIKFFYKIRFWLILAPLIITLLMIAKTSRMSNNYTVDCSIYTGIITGVNVLSESGISTTTTSQSSMMENLLNIVTADQTLKQVSLRLYARIMVYGNPDQDNIYVMAPHYHYLYDHGASIHHLIDKSSPNDSINEQRTYENLLAYEKNDPSNYVYGIYQWHLPYVNREALQKIKVDRNGNSDMIELTYTTDDPGIAFQTLQILIQEFIHQYQELRFGETNNVIAYFEAELERLKKELENAEARLTDYRVNNKVINYEEESKQVVALNSDYEIKYWEVLNSYITSDSLIKELEKRMGISADIYRQNNDYLTNSEKIANLNEKLTMLEFYPDQTHSQVIRDSLQRELRQAESTLRSISLEYGSLRYSKEGISNESVITEWLNQIILNQKAKAELKVLQDRKTELSNKYTVFAPIGSTLRQKDRNIGIIEKNYFSNLEALNSARLRQKSLQMTSATLKVMNEPSYPLIPLENHRKKIIMGAFVASLIFTIFFALLVEVLDHTLHNKLRAEMLTGSQVVGAFTRSMRFSTRRFNALYHSISAQTLCNYALTYFKSGQNNIVNIISNEPEEGKSFITQCMVEQFKAQGLEVKQLSWHNDYQTDAKAFIQSLRLPDLNAEEPYKAQDKVILVEYPSLKAAALTEEILRDVTLNLQIIDSRRTWKNTDQQLLKRTREMAGATPFFLVLNYTNRDAAEDVNGLMPPYTFFRKLFYRLSQLGLTATDRHQKYD